MPEPRRDLYPIGQSKVERLDMATMLAKTKKEKLTFKYAYVFLLRALDELPPPSTILSAKTAEGDQSTSTGEIETTLKNKLEQLFKYYLVIIRYTYYMTNNRAWSSINARNVAPYLESISQKITEIIQSLSIKERESPVVAAYVKAFAGYLKVLHDNEPSKSSTRMARIVNVDLAEQRECACRTLLVIARNTKLQKASPAADDSQSKPTALLVTQTETTFNRTRVIIRA